MTGGGADALYYVSVGKHQTLVINMASGEVAYDFYQQDLYVTDSLVG